MGAAAYFLAPAAALHLFWHVRGHSCEGREWLAGAAHWAWDQASLAALRAKALSAAAHLATHLGVFEAAISLGEEALAIARGLNDTAEIARALSRSGVIAHHQGEDERAVFLFAEALRCYRSLGNEQGMARALSNLGQVALNRGGDDRADAIFFTMPPAIGSGMQTWRVVNVRPRSRVGPSPP